MTDKKNKVKNRNVALAAHLMGNRGAGKHRNRKHNVRKGRSRKRKHKNKAWH